MKRNIGPIIAALVIVVTLAAACGPTEPSASPVPVQPTAASIPPTSAPAATPGPEASDWPSSRKYGAMVYDPLSQRLYMIGGMKRERDSFSIPEVWAYDPAGHSWQEQGKLEPRTAIGAAFDEESRRVIVQGFAQTWAYDPAADTWQQMNPGTMPSKRWGPGMAYDTESDRIVFFGGADLAANYLRSSLNDTWAYDYNSDTWTEMQPEVSPSARCFHGAVYDSASDRVLLWGGTTARDLSDQKVWAYDYNTNTWTAQKAPADAPLQRAGFGLFYHPPSGRMIVYGGLDMRDGYLVEATTWAYDYGANSWQALTPSQSPGKRAYSLVAYAPSVDKAIFFGGELTREWANEISDEAWIFDPATDEWEQVPTP
jgi:N-acetylneuraminic acid mutarotase